MIKKYHNHKLQTNPWHREEEPHNHGKTPGRQIKQSNQLCLPHQDDCKTRMGISNVQQNIDQLQTPTMGVTIKRKKILCEDNRKLVVQTFFSQNTIVHLRIFAKWHIPVHFILSTFPNPITWNTILNINDLSCC